jgi:hypothetical protein
MNQYFVPFDGDIIFLCSSTDGYLSSFCLLAVLNNAIVNVHVHILAQIRFHFFWWYTLAWNGRVGWRCFNFLSQCQTISQSPSPTPALCSILSRKMCGPGFCVSARHFVLWLQPSWWVWSSVPCCWTSCWSFAWVLYSLGRRPLPDRCGICRYLLPFCQAFFFLFDSIGVWTQGLSLARQGLYLLSHMHSQFFYFLNSVCWSMRIYSFIYSGVGMKPRVLSVLSTHFTTELLP